MNNTLEFNTLKTIQLINKDKILKRVYSNKSGSFDYVSLKEGIITKSIGNDEINIIKDLFETIIIPSPQYSEAYNKIKEEKLPRRYGKVQIMADIQKQNGIPTNLQNTMLLLAELKAINCTLLDKGVSDHYKGTNKLSDADLRNISASIRDLKKKLEPILKRK